MKRTDNDEELMFFVCPSPFSDSDFTPFALGIEGGSFSILEEGGVLFEHYNILIS
jgi:hypothetical protein